MKRAFIIMLLLVSLVLGGIFGWKAYIGYMIGQSMANMQMPPVAVSTTQVTQDQWSPAIPAVGTLRALQGVDVTAQIAGLVTELHFDSGMSVEAGDLLVKQYTADDEARLKGLQAEVELADANLRRGKELVAKNLISDTEYDSLVTDLTRAQAAERNLRLIIDQKSIRAPFAGRLGIREVDVGQYIEPGDMLARLEAAEQILVEFPVAQRYIGELHTGGAIRVISDAWPNDVFNGSIRALEAKVDPQTRSLRVQGIVDNSDARLMPGMFVRVNVVLPAQDAVLTVPQSVIAYSPYGDSVFIVDEAEDGSLIARKQFITTGETRGDQVAVVDGLEAGATVVTAGQQKLRNGSRIAVNNSVPVNNNAAPLPDNN